MDQANLAKASFNPSIPKRPVLGLWMTFEDKFYQTEGARKVKMGIIVFLVKPSWQWQWSHSNMKRWLFTRYIYSQGCTKFSLYVFVTIYSIFTLFWLEIVNFLWTCFSYLKVYSYSWYNLENVDYNFIAYTYHHFLKFNDSKLTMNKLKKTLLNISTILKWS